MAKLLVQESTLRALHSQEGCLAKTLPFLSAHIDTTTRSGILSELLGNFSALCTAVDSETIEWGIRTIQDPICAFVSPFPRSPPGGYESSEAI